MNPPYSSAVPRAPFLLLVLFWLGAAHPVQAGPGDQDLGFGPDGHAEMPAATLFRSLDAMVVQADGRITGAGPANLTGSEVGVVRWLAAGQLDPGFGTGGIRTLPVTPLEKVRIAQQADGRILVMANQSGDAGSNDIHLWRLLTTGALDPAFGTGGLVVVRPLAGYSGTGRCLAALPDGKTLVAGGSSSGSFFLRLTSSGAVDATFGSAGTLQFPFQANRDFRVTAMAVQPDGGTVACGWEKVAEAAKNPFVMRLQPDGQLDPGFGSGNGFSLLLADGQLDAITLRGDGAILAAGAYQGASLLSVLRPGGLRDTFFSPDYNGKLYGDASTNGFNAVAVQSNGRIVASGFATSGSRLIPLSAGIRSDSRLDPAFGGTSVAYHHFTPEFQGSSHATALCLLALPDRRLLVGGSYYGSGTSGAVLQRLEADPSLTPVESWRVTHFGSPVNAGTGADATDADGDGVPNLAEFAFGLDPRNSLSNALPVPVIEGEYCVMSFPDPDPADAKKIAIRAEASALLSSGSWQELVNSGDASTYVYWLSAMTNPRAWVRLRIDLLP